MEVDGFTFSEQVDEPELTYQEIAATINHLKIYRVPGHYYVHDGMNNVWREMTTQKDLNDINVIEDLLQAHKMLNQ